MLVLKHLHDWSFNDDDSETPLWQFKLQAWEGGFVKSFQIANYQPDAGFTCRR